MVTLFLGQLNDTKTSLLQYISEDAIINLSDDTIWEIHDHLAVRSFDELLKKFPPMLHMYLDTEKTEAAFSMEKTGRAGEQELFLCPEDGSFFRLLELEKDMKAGGYVYFDKETLDDHFAHEPSIREKEKHFCEQRNMILHLLAQNKEKPAALKLEDLLAEYDEGLFLLVRFLQSSSAWQTHKADSRTCIVKTGAESQLQLVAAADAVWRNAAYPPQLQQQFDRMCQRVLSGTQKSMQNPVMLYWTCIIDLPWAIRPRQDEWRLAVQKYSNFYQRLCKQFSRTAAPVFDDLYRIKQILDDAPDEHELLLANCSIFEIGRTDRLPALSRYLDTVNNKLYAGHRVTQAILPGQYRHKERESLTRMRFAGNIQDKQPDISDDEDAAGFMDILKQFRIECRLYDDNDGSPLQKMLSESVSCDHAGNVEHMW